MKVIEIPFCFYPDPVGGTEIYVESLSLNLQRQGLEVVIAAPTRDSLEETYQHKGLQVRRFAIAERLTDLRMLYGDGDECAAAAYVKILDEERPDLVHLHAFTSACSLRLVRETRRRGIPLLFTYHTPTVSCQRGTLMRWGSDVCDGRLDLGLCTSCTLHGLGVPRGLAHLVGCVPVFAGTVLGSARLSGGGWTALRMRELVHTRHTAFLTLMAEVDHVVAVSQWVRDLLLANGIPPRKVTLSRQGLPQSAGSGEEGVGSREQRAKSKEQEADIRIAFFGRLDSTKGAHIFIQALRFVPDLPVTLDVYGVVPDGANGATYLKSLQSLAGDDRRITFHAPLPSREVVGCLQGYDMLAVPSQLLETGPLVVLEAFAAGVPVLGSKVGGIAELVRHEVNGLLVEPGSIEGWGRELQRICEDRDILKRLRAEIRPPQRMATVAEEMRELYQSLTRAK